MTTTIFANGNIRNYQIALTISHTLGLVLSFIVLKLGFVPYSIVLVSILVQIIILFVRLFFSAKVCPIGLRRFASTVIVPITIATLLSIIIPFIFARSFNLNIWLTLVVCGVDALWVALVVFIVGLNRAEKNFVLSVIRKVLHKQK